MVLLITCQNSMELNLKFATSKPIQSRVYEEVT